MDVALVLTRVGLAAIFVVSGVAKLLDRTGTRTAFGDFKVPDRLAGPLVFVLPAAELATAVALLFARLARVGAVAALLLLGVFVERLTRALRRGEAPACHCFGQVHAEPSSWATVTRNIALALLAAYVVLAGPGPSLVAWVDGQSAQALGLVGTSTVAVAMTVMAATLGRQNRQLRSRQAGFPQSPLRIGERAPRFALPSVDGGVVTLHDLLAGGRPCVLTFVAHGCGPCMQLLPEIARWRETLGDRIALPVVASGDVNATADLAREHGLAQVLEDADWTVSRAYGVPGTPCAVLVASDGTVESGPAPGQEAIEALVRLALKRHGESVPTIVILA